MINSETRAFHNAVCDLIKESSLPPVNIELVLSSILRDVVNMTNMEDGDNFYLAIAFVTFK